MGLGQFTALSGRIVRADHMPKCVVSEFLYDDHLKQTSKQTLAHSPCADPFTPLPLDYPSSTLFCHFEHIRAYYHCSFLLPRKMIYYSKRNLIFRTSIRGTLILTPLLGTTWIFGLFAIGDASILFQYIFVILNSTQGIFIFVIYCVFNKEVVLKEESLRSWKAC